VLNAFNHEKEKNKALGIWGAMSGSGATGGWLIGGKVTEWLFFNKKTNCSNIVLFQDKKRRLL
jgi:hypothetical protein